MNQVLHKFTPASGPSPLEHQAPAGMEQIGPEGCACINTFSSLRLLTCANWYEVIR